MPSLSPLEILKYTSPIPLRVRSKEIDEFIQNAVAEGPIASGIHLSSFGMFLSVVFYALIIRYNHEYGLIWIFAHFVNYGVNILTFLYLSKLSKKNTISVPKTYLAFILPTTLGAFLWGVMPVLVVDKGSFVAVLSLVASCLFVYGNSSWITGLTWLSFYYAFVASIPVVVYSYYFSAEFIGVLIVSICYGIATWSSAHTFASELIKGAAQRHKLVQQSRLIENLLTEFQVNSTDWVWETDANHNIKFFSIKNENSLTEGLQSLFGMTFAQLFLEKDPNTGALENYLNEQRVFDQLIMRFNGQNSINSEGTWELRGKPVFTESGEFDGFRGYGRDVSNLQQLNDLKNSKDKFETMSKFVAKIAHDFNNSLMVIQSSAEMLLLSEKSKISKDSIEVIETVKDVVKSASRVNKELLSYARQEVLNPISVDLYAFLLDLIKKYKLRAPDVEFLLTPFSPSHVHADPHALMRTLENLFVNSIEAMNHIGQIKLSALQIDLGAGPQIIFHMEDNGPGFSPAALKSATEPFFTTKKNIGGSGLGMATAAGFVQQSGGEITWGNSPYGAFIEIRLRASSIGAVKVIAKPNESVDFYVNILMIVDDDEQILASLGRQFRTNCGELILASKFDQAVSAAKLCEKQIDLLLCDFQFDNDKRHGVDLAETLAQKCDHIIFMTGYSELADELSHYAVLPKPFSRYEFIETYELLLIDDEKSFARKNKTVKKKTLYYN